MKNRSEPVDAFFYEVFEEEGRSLREYIPAGVQYGMTAATVQEAEHAAPPARLISIRTQSVIPVDWADGLDGVLSRSTGYDHLKSYLNRIGRQLPCGYLDEYATRAVAEHAILLMMTLMRKLQQQTSQFKTFDRDGLTGSQCEEKNLLVVGVGRIGSEIAKLGAALGMNVRGVDLERRHSQVEYISPEDGIPWADSIVCAMNLTQENTGYFSAQLIRRMKRGAVLVNVARGEHTPIAPLRAMMAEGHLGGVGLDVFEDEPLVAGALRSGALSATPSTPLLPIVADLKKLAEFPNVLLTPHNAFNTVEALKRKSALAIQEVEFFLLHKDFHRRVR